MICQKHQMFRTVHHFIFDFNSIQQMSATEIHTYIRKFMAAHICMYIYNVTNLRSLDFPNPRLIQSGLQSSMRALSSRVGLVEGVLIRFLAPNWFHFHISISKDGSRRSVENAKSVRPVVATWYKLTVLTLWNEMPASFEMQKAANARRRKYWK